MAELRSPKIKVKGSYTRGIDIEMSVDIYFSDIDEQLGMKYYIQAFLYDVDAESDTILPLINKLHCQIDPVQFEDRSNEKDDILYRRFGKVFRPSNGRSQSFLQSYRLQRNPTENGILVSNAVNDAIRDDKDGRELELKAIFVLTNEVNGLLIAQSNVEKVLTVREIPT